MSTDQLWYKPLVWMDYRLAVLLTVLVPLVLIIWAFVKKVEVLQRVLIIYWRVSSLLLITVYLMMGTWPIGFVSAFAARTLIPLSLWFWIDLNEDISDLPPTSIKLVFTAWRWAVSIYNVIGAIALIPFLGCAYSFTNLKQASCWVWIEPTFVYKQYFHDQAEIGTLGFFGLTGLVLYVMYFAYFLLVRLSKQGRIAAEQ